MQSNYRVKVGDCISSSTSSYQVDQIVGSGSYGVVALCRKNTSGQTVALKVLKDLHFNDVGQKEASILRSLTESGSSSYHIVQWLDSFEYLGHYCHEFEKLDISLMKFLSKAKFESLQLKHIRPILTQMAEALLFLKSLGIMHCDLKPENIMMIDHVDQPLQIKLIDFGLACPVSEVKQGSLLGTLYYRAPEVVIGSPLSEAIDMWAVGCCAAEMFLGKVLFWADDKKDLIRMIVETLGQLPKHVLDSGWHTRNFFFLPEGSSDWTRLVDLKKRQLPCTVATLDDIYKMDPYSELKACSEVEDFDRIFFIDLIKRMLDLDPKTRISPEEVLAHPFITLTHLAQDYHEYALESENVQLRALGRYQEQLPSTCLSFPQTSEATWTQTYGQMSFNEFGQKSGDVCEESSDLIIQGSVSAARKRKRNEEEVIIVDSIRVKRKRDEVIDLVSVSTNSFKEQCTGDVPEVSPRVIILDSVRGKRKREEVIDLVSVSPNSSKEQSFGDVPEGSPDVIILDSVSPNRKRKRGKGDLSRVC